jgi:hypothetical protein
LREKWGFSIDRSERLRPRVLESRTLMNNEGMNIRHAKSRGEWAELRFMTRATALGFRVTKPWGDTAPYDLATEYHARFRRIQSLP